MSDPRVSFRANALHLSLLASLGLFASACGGSVRASGAASDGDGELAGSGNVAGNASSGSSAGSAGSAGSGSSGSSGSSGGSGGSGNSAGDDTTSGAGDGGSGPNAPGPFDCAAPQYSSDTGFASCPMGIPHRTTVVACQVTEPVDTPPIDNPAKIGDPCSSQADCAGLAFGFCPFGMLGTQTCHAGCAQDSDCASGELCLCTGSSNHGSCVQAECTTDADCAAGSYCIVGASHSTNPCAYSPRLLSCDDGKDQCESDADCGSSEDCETVGARRMCVLNVTCGRPFLVDQAPRWAALVETRAWQNNPCAAPNRAELSPSERALLAAHWARLGQMEHASIAAFARFNLQLLSLGAPAALVEACNRAIADETAHARICFGFASEYAGLPVGPGALDLNRCLEPTSLLEIAKLVLLEGCIGETTAALEAAECAAHATDPAVRAALSQIAEDETRHAELAFQFLRWALGKASGAERAEIERAASAGLLVAQPAPLLGRTANTRATLMGHGLLSDAALSELRMQAIQRTIRPLLRALFEQTTALS